MIWKINGVDVPKPDKYSVSIMDLDGSAERNLLGYLTRDRITTKRKVSAEYTVAAGEAAKAVLQSISAEFFALTYSDPLDGEKTITCYVGDRTADPFPTGEWALKFDLIER